MSGRFLITLAILFTLSTQATPGQKKRRAPKPSRPATVEQSTATTGPAPATDAGVAKTDARVSQIINRSEDYFKRGQNFLARSQPKQARDQFDRAVDAILNSGMDVRATPRLRNYYLELVERIYRLEVPLSRTSVGFKNQKFESSSKDELSRVTLTPSEPGLSQEERANLQQAVPPVDFQFNVNPLIQQFINYYQARGRPIMETGIRRSGQFMTMARRIFREEGVPEDIVWLGQVESNWNPQYVTPRGAGLWQFSEDKGKEFGLRQTYGIDERMSFEKATRASAKYLKWLANRYNGNWELAMAAYNTGEGNVDRAIQRAGRADFWAIYPYIAQETRNYVPNIMATILINKNREKYGFHNVRPDNPLGYDTIQVQSATSLQLIAAATGTSVDYIRYLNPELRKDVTPRGEAYAVRIPGGRASQAVAYIKNIPVERRDQAPRLTQAPCQLTLAQSPELRGFRLGMTLAQVREKLGDGDYTERAFPQSEFGERSMGVSGYQLKGENSKGVSRAEFGFLDDRLTRIQIIYDGSVKWNSPAEFISRVVEALGLPTSNETDMARYRLDCGGFFVDIDYGSGYMPNVTISDPEVSKVVETRRAEKEEKKRREFKP
jgi:membrane-bound lytic murein transglycosylase D